MSDRKHNFNAGPTALPLPVLQTVQKELLNYQGHGLSLIEMSHRSPVFEEVIADTRSNLSDLYDIPETHEVMFLQGGASLQFAMVPMNLGSGGVYVDTGTWSTKAAAEAQRVGEATVAWTSADTGYDRVPGRDSMPQGEGAAYVHYTSNNTIYGTQYSYEPQVAAPLVCDMSSDFISRPVDISGHDLIYAGAQKNAGPAGVTVLIIRKKLSRQFTGASTVPTILRYETQANKDSMFNTPNTFGIWVVGLVARWVKDQGGLEAMAERNAMKAQAIYETVENHPLLTGHAQVDSRSQMNVTFRTPSPEQDKALLRHLDGYDIMGLRGHRSVGAARIHLQCSQPRIRRDPVWCATGVFLR